MTDGVDTAALPVGTLGQDREAGAGEPQRQHGVGLGRGDADDPVAARLGAEGDTGEGGGGGLGVGGVREGRGHGGGGHFPTVLEGGVAEAELPGPVPVPPPGLGERGRRGPVGVQRGEPLGDPEPAEQGGVGAVRGQVLGWREGEGDAETGAVATVTVTVTGRGVVAPSGGEAAGHQRHEQERGEQPGAAVGAHGPRIDQIRCGHLDFGRRVSGGCAAAHGEPTWKRFSRLPGPAPSRHGHLEVHDPLPAPDILPLVVHHLGQRPPEGLGPGDGGVGVQIDGPVPPSATANASSSSTSLRASPRRRCSGRT